ncbi:type II toxin-antitoxin system YoeB family toxin [Oscillatoria amoena NRMC-F 0135]|nr:type II toxin-antitoxin system YoeB family toxin [Oscillatoria amoena NRMC-F 0135]
MHLVFNELSFYPIADDKYILIKRFRQLFKTFDEAKNRWGFTHIRFPQNYSTLSVTKTETFYEWISVLEDNTLKSLILGICRRPFSDDLVEEDLQTFVQSKYSLEGEKPIDQSPFGFPVAFILSTPAISIDSHVFWNNRKIGIIKSAEEEAEIKVFVYNICFEQDVRSSELAEWENSILTISISSGEEIRKYLNFTKYKIEFTQNFLDQFFEWERVNKNYFKTLLKLMKDIELHPFTGGLGKTESLKNKGKEASKRLTQADRLSYSIENDIVKFLACKGHYAF